MKKASIFGIIVLLALSTLAYGQKTITISITDSQNPVGTRHYCYHRLASGTYGTADRRDVGTAVSFGWLLAAPVVLGTHYWVCTAYAMDGTTTMESAVSNEVSWLNAPQPPTISIVNVAAIPLFKGVILSAETTAPATSKVIVMLAVFGRDRNSRPVTHTVSINPTLKHDITIPSLRPHTTYEYQWVVDSGTGVVTSEFYSFTTL